MPKRPLVVMTSPDVHAEGPIARCLETTKADMFKALALGASAICLGHPYVYGLAIELKPWAILWDHFVVKNSRSRIAVMVYDGERVPIRLLPTAGALRC